MRRRRHTVNLINTSILHYNNNIPKRRSKTHFLLCRIQFSSNAVMYAFSANFEYSNEIANTRQFTRTRVIIRERYVFNSSQLENRRNATRKCPVKTFDRVLFLERRLRLVHDFNQFRNLTGPVGIRVPNIVFMFIPITINCLFNFNYT